jgi:hypothetical protein
MLDPIVHRRAVRGAWLTTAAATGLIAVLGVARADTPEYWTRETFHTEKPIIVASLDHREATAERRASRRTSRRVTEAIDSDERPAPRRQARSTSKSKSKAKPVRVASLGATHVPAAPKPERSISGGGGIRWLASAGCLNGSLRGVLAQIASRFGAVTVNSTCRSRRHNARVGGAPRSMHLTGDAADFRINGNWGAASGFIRSLVGGFKHYGGGLFHIDTGSKRTW